MKHSSSMIGSKYFPEQNYVLVDMNEISSIFDGTDNAVMHYIINAHESLHTLTRHCGDTVNMVNNSGKIIRNLFFGESDNINIDKIVKIQIANSMLIKNSNPLQEAFTIFAMDSTYDNKFPEDKKRIFREKNITEKDLQEQLEHIIEFKNHFKEVSFSDSMIKENYEKIIWLKKTFGNEVIPLYVVCFALNIRLNEDYDAIISKNPSTDAQFRFNSVMSALENLYEKNELHKVPKIADRAHSHMESFKEQVMFEYFIENELTEITSGITDMIEGGIPIYVQKIQYNPLHRNEITSNSIFEKYNVTKTLDNLDVNILLKQSEFHVWSGYKLDRATLLVPNTTFVPDDILHFWIASFFYWNMKDCIFYNHDIEKRLDEIPILKDIVNLETVTKVKTLQQSLELEKAQDYDLLIS